ADAWPGKYSELDETLAMIKPGGFYVVDDMLPQPNWPDGHAEKAAALFQTLQAQTDFSFTSMHWSTGIILMTKKD
ncbi:MAG: SAM-dependent methyltransferase, partial [Bacteroidota bacterium]